MHKWLRYDKSCLFIEVLLNYNNLVPIWCLWLIEFLHDDFTLAAAVELGVRIVHVRENRLFCLFDSRLVYCLLHNIIKSNTCCERFVNVPSICLLQFKLLQIVHAIQDKWTFEDSVLVLQLCDLLSDSLAHFLLLCFAHLLSFDRHLEDLCDRQFRFIKLAASSKQFNAQICSYFLALILFVGYLLPLSRQF